MVLTLTVPSFMPMHDALDGFVIAVINEGSEMITVIVEEQLFASLTVSV